MKKLKNVLLLLLLLASTNSIARSSFSLLLSSFIHQEDMDGDIKGILSIIKKCCKT